MDNLSVIDNLLNSNHNKPIMRLAHRTAFCKTFL